MWNTCRYVKNSLSFWNDLYFKRNLELLLFVSKRKKFLMLCNTLFFNKSLKSSTKVGNTGMFVLPPVTRHGKHYKLYLAIHLSRILMYFNSKLKFNKGCMLPCNCCRLKVFFSDLRLCENPYLLLRKKVHCNQNIIIV